MGATYLGTDVRYVKTLDTTSSGTSLKRALSGRVIIQALSFPRPPRMKTQMLPWVSFPGGPEAKPRSTSQVRKHTAIATEGFLHHQSQIPPLISSTTHTGGRNKCIRYHVFPLFTECALHGIAKEGRNTRTNQRAGLKPIEIHFKAKHFLMH